jgi:hypothetical protein
MTKFYILFILLLLLSSCSDRNPQNPFDPNSNYQTTAMQGELTITQLTDSQIKLEWQLNTTIIDNYILKRKVNLGACELLTTINKDTNLYTDNELLTTNTYFYQLIGANGEVQTEPLENSINPLFTEITDFDIQQDNIFTSKLTWQHECDYEEGYIIERREVTERYPHPNLFPKGEGTINNTIDKLPFKRGDVRQLPDRGVKTSKNDNAITNIDKEIPQSRDFIQIADLPANSIEFFDEEIIPNILYEYKIHSYTTLNTSDESIFAYDNAIPSPLNLSYEKLTISSIKLTWQDSCNGEEGFKIDKKVGVNDWQIEYVVLCENVEEWVDANAEINENLQYRVYAVNSNYISDYSNTGIIDNTIPSPSNLIISQLNVHTFSLNWDDNSIGEEGFTIERKIDNSNYSLIFTSSENVTSYVDDINSRDNFEELYYRIRAFYGNLTSNVLENSLLINFEAPSDFTATILNINSAQLDWIDNSNGEDGFIIDRRIDTNEWENNYCTLQENATTWTDNNTAIDAVLAYRIHAYSGINCSDSTFTVVNNPFNAPSNLNYNILSMNVIELFWDDNSNGEQGFKIDRKIMDNAWEIEYGIVDSNMCEWTDEIVEPWQKNEYRIYAYHEEDISDKVNIQPFITFSEYLNTSWGSKANDILQTVNGGFIIAGYQEGYSTGSYYGKLIKYDIFGNIMWEQTYPDDHCRLSSVQQTNDGGYICLGRIAPTGQYNFWLVKTDMNGDIEWEQTFGSDQHDYGYSLEQTNDGGFVLAGYTFETENSGGLLIKTDSNGNMIWNSYFNDANWIYSVQQTNDEGFILTGMTNHMGSGNDDFVLIKTDSNGLEEWSYPYGGSDFEIARCVSQTSEGGFIIVGQTNSFGSGMCDGWIVKTDAYGIEEWNQTYGSSLNDAFNAIELTDDNGFIITGYKNVTGSIYEEGWLVKINVNGDIDWEQTYQFTDHTIGYSVNQTIDQGFVIAGTTNSGAYDDILIFKTDNVGNINEQTSSRNTNRKQISRDKKRILKVVDHEKK